MIRVWKMATPMCVWGQMMEYFVSTSQQGKLDYEHDDDSFTNLRQFGISIKSATPTIGWILF